MDEDEAADTANEILRELQQSWIPTSSLIDYAIHECEDTTDELDDSFVNETYEEGDAFKYKHWARA